MNGLLHIARPKQRYKLHTEEGVEIVLTHGEHAGLHHTEVTSLLVQTLGTYIPCLEASIVTCMHRLELRTRT